MAHAAHGTSDRSARVRAGLAHPVVDADGHWQESIPVFLDYLAEEGGPQAVDGLIKITDRSYGNWHAATSAERLERRPFRPPFWPEPSNTLDRATSLLPALLHERLDELGIDVALVYPTLGLIGLTIEHEELRRPFRRAANRMARDAFAPHADRLLPVGLVPHQTPEEALEALEEAVELGFRAIFTTGAVRRTAAGTGSPYIDFLALDSPHDYDPFWQRCLELGVAVTVHGGSIGWPDRSSPSNSVFNHVGHFANASQGFCKALVLGGVARRFPGLRFGFLEGGAGWGAQLYADIVGHWEKRNLEAVLAHVRPANLDQDELRRLFARYATGSIATRFDDYWRSSSNMRPFKTVQELTDSEPDLDEFAASGVTDVEDLRRVFEDQFSFGCEADDVLTAWAFDGRVGVRLRAMFGSDIGHFDVLDMSTVLSEAYELVGRELISEDAFERFTFRNVVELHTAGNPAFFAGTVIEDRVTGLLGTPSHDRQRG